MAASSELVMRNKVGLHARPAALFVQTAASFTSKITLENLSNGKVVNAKSLLSLLTSGVRLDDHIRITAEGDDEEQAVAALCHLVTNNFGEEVNA